MKTHVLDASALMAFLEDRAGAERVEELLAKAAEAKRPLLMSVVNWGEVYYSVWRARGEKAADAKLAKLYGFAPSRRLTEAEGNKLKEGYRMKEEKLKEGGDALKEKWKEGGDAKKRKKAEGEGK